MKKPNLGGSVSTHFVADCRLQGVIINDLIAPGGIPDLISVQYKSKNQKDLQQHLKESLDQKLTLKIPALLNSLQQKGIPETIKLGNKNNNQDINALLKIHSS